MEFEFIFGDGIKLIFTTGETLREEINYYTECSIQLKTTDLNFEIGSFNLYGAWRDLISVIGTSLSKIRKPSERIYNPETIAISYQKEYLKLLLGEPDQLSEIEKLLLYSKDSCLFLFPAPEKSTIVCATFFTGFWKFEDKDRLNEEFKKWIASEKFRAVIIDVSNDNLKIIQEKCQREFSLIFERD